VKAKLAATATCWWEKNVIGDQTLAGVSMGDENDLRVVLRTTQQEGVQTFQV